jgi:ATP-dependent protease HslVU (ClpYQ) peptidase subunit
MTVCIAAFFENDSIIAVSDMMVSTGDFSADDLAIKNRELHPQWRVMISGNDLTRLLPVVDAIGEALDKSKKYTYQEVQRIAKLAYQGELRSQIQDAILSRYNLTYKTLFQLRADDPIYSDLRFQMAEATLGFTLLFFGHDGKHRPHIFTVENPGNVCNHDLIGFWAIGSGSNRAMSSLFAHPYNCTDSLWKATYIAYEAKFMAESAGGVGKETVSVVMRPDGKASASVSCPELRQFWESAGRPRVPAEAEAVVGRFIEEEFFDLD